MFKTKILVFGLFVVLFSACAYASNESSAGIMFTISSFPSNAKIWIDEVYTKHLTPTNEIEQKDVINLWTAGIHKLKLTKTGYIIEQEIELKTGEKLVLNLTMQSTASTENQTGNNISESQESGTISEETKESWMSKETEIEIIKTRDNYSFGDFAGVKIRLFKGDTPKNSIKIWIENLSEKYEFNFYGKLKEYLFVVPLKITDNCEGRFSDSNYDVVAEGLELKKTKTIFVSGAGKCREKTVYAENNESRKSKSMQTQNSTERIINISKGDIYASGSAIEQRIGIYFLCFVLILLISALLLKRRKTEQEWL